MSRHMYSVPSVSYMHLAFMLNSMLHYIIGQWEILDEILDM